MATEPRAACSEPRRETGVQAWRRQMRRCVVSYIAARRGQPPKPFSLATPVMESSSGATALASASCRRSVRHIACPRTAADDRIHRFSRSTNVPRYCVGGFPSSRKLSRSVLSVGKKTRSSAEKKSGLGPSGTARHSSCGEPSISRACIPPRGTGGTPRCSDRRINVDWDQTERV